MTMALKNAASVVADAGLVALGLGILGARAAGKAAVNLVGGLAERAAAPVVRAAGTVAERARTAAEEKVFGAQKTAATVDDLAVRILTALAPVFGPEALTIRHSERFDDTFMVRVIVAGSASVQAQLDALRQAEQIARTAAATKHAVLFVEQASAELAGQLLADGYLAWDDDIRSLVKYAK